MKAEEYKNWSEYDEENSDFRDKESLRNRKEGRLRRVSDFLPVRMQDQLWYCKSEVREQQKVIYVVEKEFRRKTELFSCVCNAREKSSMNAHSHGGNYGTSISVEWL